jgi:hypothetical protein
MHNKQLMGYGMISLFLSGTVPGRFLVIRLILDLISLSFTDINHGIYFNAKTTSEHLLRTCELDSSTFKHIN